MFLGAGVKPASSRNMYQESYVNYLSKTIYRKVMSTEQEHVLVIRQNLMLLYCDLWTKVSKKLIVDWSTARDFTVSTLVCLLFSDSRYILGIIRLKGFSVLFFLDNNKIANEVCTNQEAHYFFFTQKLIQGLIYTNKLKKKVSQYTPPNSH